MSLGPSATILSNKRTQVCSYHLIRNPSRHHGTTTTKNETRVAAIATMTTDHEMIDTLTFEHDQLFIAGNDYITNDASQRKASIAHQNMNLTPECHNEYCQLQTQWRFDEYYRAYRSTKTDDYRP